MKRALFLLVLIIAWFPLQAGAIEIEESDSFVGPADIDKVRASLGIPPTQTDMFWYGPIPDIALTEVWVDQNKLKRRTAYITQAEASIGFSEDSVYPGNYDIWLYVTGYYEDMVADIATIYNGWLLTEAARSYNVSDSVFQGDVCMDDFCDYLVNVELKGSISKVTGDLSINGKFKGGVSWGGYMFSGTLRFKLPLDAAGASTLSGSKVFEKIRKIRNMKRFKE
jgi:hypothetical protein